MTDNSPLPSFVLVDETSFSNNGSIILTFDFPSIGSYYNVSDLYEFNIKTVLENPLDPVEQDNFFNLTLVNDPILTSGLSNETLKIGQEFNYTLIIQTNKTIDGSADGIKVE